MWLVVGAGEIDVGTGLSIDSPRCLRRLCSSRFSRRVKPEPELRLQFKKGQKSGRRADMCIL
jgi:hypothetical protein